MVMADKNSEELRNGRRSRGASPRSEDSSGGEDSDQDGGMRVGDDYQAEIPPFNPDQKIEGGVDAMLVWAPNNEMSDAKVDEYINIAKEKHGYNTEQALGMLFWHKHNIERALADLANFTPFPDEWTVEDKVLFEQAFSFHGKSFHRIRQMLPDKSISSLVKYFYSWKKTRSRTSLMDRHAKKRATHRLDSEGGSDQGSSNSDEDAEVKDKEEKNQCTNCGLSTTQLHVSAKGSLCSSCYQYWRRTGEMRSAGPKRHESQQAGRHNPMKHKRRPPKGMYLDQEDLMAMVSGPPGQAEAILKALDSEIVSLKRQVQNNKQLLSLQKHKLGNGVDSFKPPEPPLRINSRWTNEELLLAVQGVRKYGKDFQAIAEVIGNKLEPHVRSFFVNFRRRYNLDEVLAEYEAEHGTQMQPDEEAVIAEMGDNASGREAKPSELEKAEGGETADTEKMASQTQTNGSSVTSTAVVSAPPPLLKQPPTALSGGRSGTTPHASRLLPQKTILQQPPPLIKPASSPSAAQSVVKVPITKDAKE
ncbi:hypothetical protein C0Q70_14017 [Pomacea canaliculata]|uniref:REST corepressor 3 n=1 Tax=Pomacea canaliculata TaxID=400727 RepID=A0A2T7NYW8_POMCA|nr:REST corepressor 3-like isoform X2 [Pomacea canaliculata]PVD26346.1 hypothetical protein C0Q70_14017 [Pomacea canaliculata]